MPLLRRYQALVSIIDRATGFRHEDHIRSTMSLETVSLSTAKKEFVKSARDRAGHRYGIPEDEGRGSVTSLVQITW